MKDIMTMKITLQDVDILEDELRAAAYFLPSHKKGDWKVVSMEHALPLAELVRRILDGRITFKPTEAKVETEKITDVEEVKDKAVLEVEEIVNEAIKESGLQAFPTRGQFIAHLSGVLSEKRGEAVDYAEASKLYEAWEKSVESNNPFNTDKKETRAADEAGDAPPKAAPVNGAALVLPGTGEVVDFSHMLDQVDQMTLDQKAQACAALVCSGVLGNLTRKLKGDVIVHMRDNDATLLPIPGGELKLTSTVKNDYDYKALEAIPECKPAITYEPKVGKRELNKVLKLGGDIKKKVEAAIMPKDPTFSLEYKRKPEAAIED